MATFTSHKPKDKMEAIATAILAFVAVTTAATAASTAACVC